MSIRQSKFINHWKIGKVVPLYKGKSSDQLSPKGYRPISLLPLISKIAERVVQSQLVEHFNVNNMWNSNQYGYRKGRSTATTLLTITDQMFEAAEAREIANLITIDESAAFDSIEGNILLDKLKLYKLDESTLNWIKSYLNHRSQYCSIGGQNSNIRTINKGVPQGSVLGPVLFTIYTNELSEITKNTECVNPKHNKDKDKKLFGYDCNVCGITPAYADDSTHITRHKKREHNQQNMANNLTSIAEYLESNRLTVNQAKTQILETMVYQKKCKIAGNPPMLAVLDEKKNVKILEANNYIRLLGVNLGSNLTWEYHLNTGQKSLLGELRSKLGGLSLLRKEIPKAARLVLANGIILSKMQYTMPVWGGLPKKNIRKLQTILNATARFVTGLSRQTSTPKLMEACKWMYATEMIEYHSLLTLWRILKDKQSNYFESRIVLDPVDLKIKCQRPD